VPEILNSLSLGRARDSYRRPCLIDKASGKIVRFEPVLIPGKGWTVAKVVGSAKTGRTSETVPEFTNTYTLAQAQLAASNFSRDVTHALVELGRNCTAEPFIVAA